MRERWGARLSELSVQEKLTNSKRINAIVFILILFRLIKILIFLFVNMDVNSWIKNIQLINGYKRTINGIKDKTSGKPTSRDLTVFY
jgi:hypothetical protein